LQSCKATLRHDTLIIANEYIARTFLWNGGNLITVNLWDKKNNQTWNWIDNNPDVSLPGHAKVEGKGSFEVRSVINQPNQSNHLEISVIAKLGLLDLKRVFQIYPNVAAITCTFYLRGKADEEWHQSIKKSWVTTDFKNIESQKNLNTADPGVPVMDKLSLAGNHWQLRPVEFFDMTDRTNTLVKETTYNVYTLPGLIIGNLLLIKDLISDYSFFVLKESPSSQVQLANPGFDFLAKKGSIQTVGMGILPTDLRGIEWTIGYGYTLGLGNKTQLELLKTLRSYQDAKRQRKADRVEMLMMNTWGDRNRDMRVSEKFILSELKKAAELGITHYQIDDGWQSGRPVNSAFGGGRREGIWDNKSYWLPDSLRYPNGLKTVVAEARRNKIELGLWFSPSLDSNFKHWEKDANVLIGLNHKHGIKTFKIDMIQIHEKAAEENFRKLIDTVLKATNYTVTFNMDVTAGRRNGYHFFNEYVSLFLENRYTDWVNYYPYCTLRNLWSLSRYLPAQKRSSISIAN